MIKNKLYLRIRLQVSHQNYERVQSYVLSRLDLGNSETNQINLSRIANSINLKIELINSSNDSQFQLLSLVIRKILHRNLESNHENYSKLLILHTISSPSYYIKHQEI